MTHVGFAASCLIGLVFGISAVSKLRSFGEFARTTRLLLIAVAGPRRPLSYTGTRSVSVAVAAAESAIPALALVPVLNPVGLGLAGLLLVGFGVGIAAAMRRGVRTSCRCFGASSQPLGARHLVRNAALLLVAVAGLTAGPAGDIELAGRVIAAGAAAILAVLVFRLDDLIDLFTPNPSTRRT